MICDFCSAPDPQHTIPCRSFDVDEILLTPEGFRSLDEWMACDACCALIQDFFE